MLWHQMIRSEIWWLVYRSPWNVLMWQESDLFHSRSLLSAQTDSRHSTSLELDLSDHEQSKIASRPRYLLQSSTVFADACWHRGRGAASWLDHRTILKNQILVMDWLLRDAVSLFRPWAEDSHVTEVLRFLIFEIEIQMAGNTKKIFLLLDSERKNRSRVIQLLPMVDRKSVV